MPKKPFEYLTEQMFYILMALNDGKKCGIEIVEYINAKTRGRVRLGPATLYTLLSKFEASSMINEVETDGRKRTYEITESGTELYLNEIERLRVCVRDADTV
ncbi:MAG: helix-turn-helix transcriptional regulator [Clostridia bacterium]|nr:helix-turn-helix transcriptional regulator [Clostridia bacterium]